MTSLSLRACLLVIAFVQGTVAVATVDAATAADTRVDNPANWDAYGRTADQQHYSPLEQIDARNIGRLGLAWSMDLDAGNPVSEPWRSMAYFILASVTA